MEVLTLHRPICIPLILLFWFFISVTGIASASADSLPTVKSLNNNYDAEIHQTLLYLSGQSVGVKKINELARLRQQVEELQSKYPAQALLILYQNQRLLLGKASEEDFYTIVRSALQIQGVGFVTDLLQEFQTEANDYVVARIRFELMRYWASASRWSEVLAQYQGEEMLAYLPETQLAEVQLFVATAFQKSKKHREAITIYESMESDSAVYRLVLLNLSIAYLRQGWWADAQLAIEKSIALNTGVTTDLDHRMYTVLGFAQLQYGFYRDARSSFRQVALDNQYTYRALFGLGLAALHQKDFTGALNAFSRLRAITSDDISVAESYLLYAFTLLQMQQFDASLTAYQEAIDYYQQLIAEHTALSNKTRAFLRLEHRKAPYLIHLQKKQNLLSGLLRFNLPAANQQQLLHAQAIIASERESRRMNFFNNEISDLESYLSQSRFGLASLYDQK